MHFILGCSYTAESTLLKVTHTVSCDLSVECLPKIAWKPGRESPTVTIKAAFLKMCSGIRHNVCMYCVATACVFLMLCLSKPKAKLFL